MVFDRVYLAKDLTFQCQGWMKSRIRTLSVDNFTLKSWNNLWNENSKVWKHRRRQLLHAEQTACLFSILCAFKSAFRTNCAWHSSLEIWVLDFVKIACTLICECLKIFLMISLSTLLTWMKAWGWKNIYISSSYSCHKMSGIIPIICATFWMNESASSFSFVENYRALSSSMRFKLHSYWSKKDPSCKLRFYWSKSNTFEHRERLS